VISKAKVRFLSTSAQKARLVVNQIRGRPVGEALSLLGRSPKIVARDIEKLVHSAVANAQQGDARLDVDRLYISRAVVDQGPTEKRARARSMGRVYRILKRRCHVAVELDAKA